MQALGNYTDDSDTSPGPSRRKGDQQPNTKRKRDSRSRSRSPSRPSRPSPSDDPSPPSRRSPNSQPVTAMSSRRVSPDRIERDESPEITEEDVRRATYPSGEEGWGIPPAVDPAQADERLKAKVTQFLRLKKDGQHIITSLMQSSSFANPHIYSKLVEFVDIDERASAFPNGGWLTRQGLEAQIPTYGPKALLSQQNAMAEAVKRSQAGRKEIAFTGSKTDRKDRERDRDRDRERRRDGKDRDRDRDRGGLHRSKHDWEGSGRRERHRR